MLNQIKESMVLPDEYNTKITEEFKESGIKSPKNSMS